MPNRLSLVSPKPRQSQHATVLLFPIIPLYLSTWALLDVTGVVQRPFYHVCFDSIVVRRGCRSGTLGMVTDRVNVLSVRSRTTRSSKGKVCPLSSHFPFLLFSFEHHPSLYFPLLSPPHPSTHPPRVPFDLAHPFFSPLSFLTSSSRTQKQTHSSSRSNSVSSVSTRPTQPATEIAFSVRFQTNCLAPSLVISSFARTYVIGFSLTESVMLPSLTMNAAWTSTFLSCVNQVRPHLCSIISQAPTRLHIPSHLWRPSRTLRVRAYEKVQCQGHPTRSRLSHRVGCRLGCRRRCGCGGNSHFIDIFSSHNSDTEGAHRE
jgi:hypothetical protein